MRDFSRLVILGVSLVLSAQTFAQFNSRGNIGESP